MCSLILNLLTPNNPPDTAKYYYIAEYDGENFKDRPSVKIVDNKCEVAGSGDVECYNVDDTGKTRVGCENESATDEMLKQPTTFGFNSGLKNKISGTHNGIWNTFFGNQSGLNNITGHANVFIGQETGKAHTAGISIPLLDIRQD